MKNLRLLDVGLILLYKVMLDLTWVYLIFPAHAYEPQFSGFGTPDSTKIATSYILSLVAVAVTWMISDEKRVSRFITLVQLVIIVIPYLALYGMQDLPDQYLAYILLGYVMSVVTIWLVPNIHFRVPGRQMRILLSVSMTVIVVYVYLGLIFTGGLSRFNLNFADVYVVRKLADQRVLPGFGYFISWTAYVFNMVVLIKLIEARDRKRSFTLLGIAGVIFLQIILFGMTNSKSFLFIPFVVLGFVWLCRRIDSRRAVLFGAPAFLCGLLLLSMLSVWGPALLSRIFYIPAAMHSLYFEYFSLHPLALWAGHGLGHWFGISSAQDTVHIIAQHYWRTTFSPNVGWIGDAFGNFGVLGVVSFGVIFGIFLRVADSLAIKMWTPGVIEGLFAAFAVALCSSALGTVLLTHGGFVLLIALWTMKKPIGDNMRGNAKIVFDEKPSLGKG